MKERLFTWVEHWHDSAGYYAVMPINYANKDCYIMLDSDDMFGIYNNDALEPFMDKDMLLTGNMNDCDIDYQIKIYLNMLKLLRDMYK